MTLRTHLILTLFAATVLCGTGRVHGQVPEPYEPLFAQPGKDVVWVPTPEPMVELMLTMARVAAGDVVVDLGSGDGRMVIAAARRGATARGVEFNPDMVRLSRRRAIEAGVQDRATFVEGDMFTADISDATVLAVFLLTENMRRLQPTILALRPGTRVVSNTFAIPEWPPDERQTRPDCSAWCTALLWIVPAQVHGEWQVEGGPRLRLDQHFQKVTGLLTGPVGSSPVQGTVAGAEVTMTLGDATIRARLNGARLVGTRTEGGRSSAWAAGRP